MAEQGKRKLENLKTFIRYRIGNALRCAISFIDILLIKSFYILNIDDVFQYCEVQNIKNNCCANRKNVKYCQVPLSEI